VFFSNKVTRKCQTNILEESGETNNCNCVEERKRKDCSLHRDYKLFLDKNWFEVVRVDCNIAGISFFRINILLSNKNIQFDTKMFRADSNYYTYL